MNQVFGVTGWKNAGKTTLTERLVAEFVRRGWTVATVKHAHHAADIDKPDTDSFQADGARTTRADRVSPLSSLSMEISFISPRIKQLDIVSFRAVYQ